MKYGNVTLTIEKGSLTRATKKTQIVRHYPGTDRADVFSLGKEPTTITCVLIANGDAERILLESILHSTGENNLYLDNYFYKRVVPGESSEPTKIDETYSSIPAEFVALDPIPYSTATGEALY